MATQKRAGKNKKPAPKTVGQKTSPKASSAASPKAAAGPSRKPDTRLIPTVDSTRRNTLSVTQTGSGPSRADYASAGLNALRERLGRAANAPGQAGKRGGTGAAKADARLDATLQNLAESYRRILD